MMVPRIVRDAVVAGFGHSNDVTLFVKQAVKRFLACEQGDVPRRENATKTMEVKLPLRCVS